MRLALLFLLAVVSSHIHATQTSRTYVLDWVVGDSENRVAATSAKAIEVRMVKFRDLQGANVAPRSDFLAHLY